MKDGCEKLQCRNHWGSQRASPPPLSNSPQKIIFRYEKLLINFLEAQQQVV